MFEKSRVEIVSWIKRDIDDKFRRTRIENESKAVKLMDRSIDTLTIDKFKLFCSYWNYEHLPREFANPPSCTRFASGYGVSLKITKQPDSFNSFCNFLSALWNTIDVDDARAKQLYEQLIARNIPNAKIFIFTLLLYLKKPMSYNVCTDRLAAGLHFLMGKAVQSRMIHSFDDYIEYNKCTMELRQEYNLYPQDVDYILRMGYRNINPERGRIDSV